MIKYNCTTKTKKKQLPIIDPNNREDSNKYIPN